MTETKYCRDCRYFRSPFGASVGVCLLAPKDEGRFDLVGERIDPVFLNKVFKLAASERGENGSCGPDANLFEAAPVVVAPTRWWEFWR